MGTIVNVVSTPISFWTVERFGRRPLLIWGAAGMFICQLIVAVVGMTVGFNKTYTNAAGDPVAQNISAVNAQVAFIAIGIFFFASTWGPGAWVLIGEIFPLPIRSRGVGLSTASNWLWNTIIAVITPYMVGEDRGNLRSSVFFVWSGTCFCCLIYDPPRPGNEGSLARAGRPDAVRDLAPSLGQVAPDHDFCRRGWQDPRRRSSPRGCRGRQEDRGLSAHASATFPSRSLAQRRLRHLSCR